MHLYNATTTTFSYILVVAFYYLVACIMPVLEIFFFFSDDYVIQQKPASTLCIQSPVHSTTIYMKKKTAFLFCFFFVSTQKKTPGHPLNFQLGFLFVAPAGTAIVIDCVWCVFNVEPNEV